MVELEFTYNIKFKIKTDEADETDEDSAKEQAKQSVMEELLKQFVIQALGSAIANQKAVSDSLIGYEVNVPITDKEDN